MPSGSVKRKKRKAAKRKAAEHEAAKREAAERKAFANHLRMAAEHEAAERKAAEREALANDLRMTAEREAVEREAAERKTAYYLLMAAKFLQIRSVDRVAFLQTIGAYKYFDIVSNLRYGYVVEEYNPNYKYLYVILDDTARSEGKPYGQLYDLLRWDHDNQNLVHASSPEDLDLRSERIEPLYCSARTLAKSFEYSFRISIGAPISSFMCRRGEHPYYSKDLLNLFKARNCYEMLFAVRTSPSNMRHVYARLDGVVIQEKTEGRFSGREWVEKVSFKISETEVVDLNSAQLCHIMVWRNEERC